MDLKNFADIGRSLSLVFQLGLVLICAIGIGLFVGIKLDTWLGTRGIFLVLGIIFGIAAGFWQAYLLLTRTK